VGFLSIGVGRKKGRGKVWRRRNPYLILTTWGVIGKKEGGGEKHQLQLLWRERKERVPARGEKKKEGGSRKSNPAHWSSSCEKRKLVSSGKSWREKALRNF